MSTKDAAAEKKDTLLEQRLEDLKIEELTPISQIVMQRQATINIGTIGHVAHGKSTVVKAISGVMTVRFKQELERNITIKLGYANAKIYKCDNPKCPRPGNYKSFGSAKGEKPPCPRPGCGFTMTLQRHVSFVDCPGHDILMATMLNGAAVMDAALLLVAANEPCPQPQTSEHLAAVGVMKMKHILILQNKIDLVKEKEAASQYEEIVGFIRGTTSEGAPIIPISAQLNYNLDVICEYICKKIPIPVRDFLAAPQLIVIRSFDVNKPGEEVNNLQGGVAGGSIIRGVLKVGQEIEIRPGITKKDKQGRLKCFSIFSKIVDLQAESNHLKFAAPGGLIGVGTKIDPTLTRADRLVGGVLGDVGTLPDIFIELEISFFLLRLLLGVKVDGAKKKAGKIKKLAKGETVMVNIGSTSTGARILQTKGDLAKVALNKPVCSSEGEKLAISRRVDKHWRLIGWGKIRRGIRILANDDAPGAKKKKKKEDSEANGSEKEKKKKKKEKNEADGPEKEKKKKKKKEKQDKGESGDDSNEDKEKKKKKKKKKDKEKEKKGESGDDSNEDKEKKKKKKKDKEKKKKKKDKEKEKRGDSGEESNGDKEKKKKKKKKKEREQRKQEDDVTVE